MITMSSHRQLESARALRQADIDAAAERRMREVSPSRSTTTTSPAGPKATRTSRMRHGWAVLLALAVSLVIGVVPVTAASTSHVRERGSTLEAYFTNEVWDVVAEDTTPGGGLAPGDYFDTYVYGATWLEKAGGTTSNEQICVDHYGFTIDAEGNWTDETWFSVCGDAQTLTLDRNLASGRVVGSFDATECSDWDEDGNCMASSSIGVVSLDLTFAGTGSLERWHGTDSGGAAGGYQYTAHGTGAQRTADVTGTVALDGTSIIDGALYSDGWLSTVKSGYVDVWHD
jgi:hypothetical protein